jgi:hypothetical protein
VGVFAGHAAACGVNNFNCCEDRHVIDVGTFHAPQRSDDSVDAVVLAA